jgi:DNA-binding NtrC family response regulator
LFDFVLRGPTRIVVWESPAGSRPANSLAPTIDTFRAALADARDGRPRALDLVEPLTADWAWLQRVMAREARCAGFVPLAADALGAVLAQARWRWPSWLKTRSLVVFATDSHISSDAAVALFRLATRDARPHLIVRAATGDLTWRTRMVALPMQVHEDPQMSTVADGDHPDVGFLHSPDALIVRARELHAAGRLVEAEAAARWSVLLSAPGEMHASAQCALAHCLIAQRRLLEARAVLLQVEGEQADRLRAEILSAGNEPRSGPAMAEAFLDVLRICQDAAPPPEALTQVAALLRDRLSAATVAFVARDGDWPRVVARAGTTAPVPAQLEIALRVLDTGVAVPARSDVLTVEGAWPVRYGAEVVGAVWCHWPMGLPLVPGDVELLVGVTATATAPAMHAAVEEGRAPRSSSTLVPDLIGESAAMQSIRLAVIRAAASSFPVLIEGESGSGKELVARAIHSVSARRGRKFCPLNCAALADDLVEAELFGHTRGAFTGAVAERIGLFEEAQGGTLFLDEVAELGSRVQAKLLRVLQEGEVRRLGESIVRRVDARIVAATNRPLEAESDSGRFRRDLRYRLDVLRIAIPPLRDRLEDVPILVRHVWAMLARKTESRAVLSPAAFSALGAYDWPGNVRELQNVLASVMVAGPARGTIGPSALPSHIVRAAALGSMTTLAEARRAFEARYVKAALARANGNSGAAARDLGVSRQGLSKLLARLDLAARDSEQGAAH